MNKVILITTIFRPTKAVKTFSNIEGYQLVVVGDKKTPPHWKYNNVKYLSVDQQEDLDFKLTTVLPYNHYCRKMVGYLYAIKNGADVIIDTDDDNIPKEGWGFPESKGNFNFIPKGKGFVNTYKYFTNHEIWPRGFPLENIMDDKIELSSNLKNFKVGVWQGLADGDPDVDAIYRLTTNNKCCIFNDKDPIVLDKLTMCPFNSQNTLFFKELFPLLYLPAFVSFRFTDILRGLIAQPVMWQYGYHLGFIGSTVTQERNVHNYFDDFLSEIPMYQNTQKVVELTSMAISSNKSISDNLMEAYKALFYSNIVKKKELLTLEAWLTDIN